MGKIPNPVIVVPGITATYLKDQYPLPPELVWSVLTKEYERTTLHPDDLRYESKEPARVVPDQVFEVAYKELIAELRYNLAAKPEQPVPVFPFGYDWRQPLDQTERQLEAFIDEVIDRTKLLRHYHADKFGDDPRVNLVGHSMGGLIIAGYIKRRGKQHRVCKIATLASPYRGSFEAVIKVATGTADLGGGDSNSREREAARLTPALYHLLPTMAGGLAIDDTSLGTSLFEPSLWQPSVQRTIAQFVKLHGLGKTNADDQAAEILSSMLARASEHRQQIESLSLKDAELNEEDWLCVVGADCTTRTRLRIRSDKQGRPEFDLASADRENGYGSGTPNEQRRTGDGTVPLDGAVPGFLREENLVCVTPGDFGYWEVQDRLVSSVAGFHGILPNMNLIHRLIVRHFTGTPDRHGNTWGRPIPGVSNVDWKPAIPRLTAKG
jgi:pimeloyl-ACP methyl ester carboxylesterase